MGRGVGQQHAKQVRRHRLPPPSQEVSAHRGMGGGHEHIIATSRLSGCPVGITRETQCSI